MAAVATLQVQLWGEPSSLLKGCVDPGFTQDNPDTCVPLWWSSGRLYGNKRQISSCVTGTARPMVMHTAIILAEPKPLGFNSGRRSAIVCTLLLINNQRWKTCMFFTFFLKNLLCMWTSALLLRHEQLGSMEKSYQMDNRGNVSVRQDISFRHTCRITGCIFFVCSRMLKAGTVHQPYCVGIIYLGLVKKMTVA